MPEHFDPNRLVALARERAREAQAQYDALLQQILGNDGVEIPTATDAQTVQNANRNTIGRDGQNVPPLGEAVQPPPNEAHKPRAYRRRVSRPDLKRRPVQVWMIRWTHALSALGGRAYLRDLRRATNYHKDKSSSAAALARLVMSGCFELRPEGRRTLIILRNLTDSLLQIRPKPKRRRHARRSRGRTPWFEKMLREREEDD